MNHKELKQQVLIDLNTILNMSVQEIETKSQHTIPELCELFTTRHRKADITDVLQYESNRLPENWEIKHEQLMFSFPGSMAFDMVKMVKNGFSDGSEPKHKEKTKREYDYSGKELQQRIMNWRHAYQSKDGYTFIENYSSKTMYKEQVIEKYEKSKPNSPIRLCWKYITNPVELEGVHFAWQNPVVTVSCIENSVDHMAFKNKPFAKIEKTFTVNKIEVKDELNRTVGYKFENVLVA